MPCLEHTSRTTQVNIYNHMYIYIYNYTYIHIKRCKLSQMGDEPRNHRQNIDDGRTVGS